MTKTQALCKIKEDLKNFCYPSDEVDLKMDYNIHTRMHPQFKLKVPTGIEEMVFVVTINRGK